MTKNQHRRLIINYRRKGEFAYLTDIIMGHNLTRRISFSSTYSLIHEDNMYLYDDYEGEQLIYGKE